MELEAYNTLHVVVHPLAFDMYRNYTQSAQLCEHNLEVHSYKTFTFCDYCHDMLWGIMKQGVKCKGCKRNYHKRCAHLLPKDCLNDGGLSKRRALESNVDEAQD